MLNGSDGLVFHEYIKEPSIYGVDQGVINRLLIIEKSDWCNGAFLFIIGFFAKGLMTKFADIIIFSKENRLFFKWQILSIVLFFLKNLTQIFCKPFQ